MYHTCDDNGNNILNTDEETDFISIHYINATNDISMNYYDNFINRYDAPFLSSNSHEDVFSGSEYDSEKLTNRRHKNIILG